MHVPCGKACSHRPSCTCQTLVRFLAYIELNHMLHRLCGPPSIPLSFTLASILPRRCTYRLSYGTDARMAPTPSAHRLQRGLPGYLILFAPHAFAPQRQSLARSSPSPPVFFQISTDFTPTPGIPAPPPKTPVPQFPAPSIGWADDFHARLTKPPTRPLRPVIPNNACPIRVTGAAGT